MTDQQHPITPPPELVRQWWKDAQRADYSDGLPCWLNYVATQAARWGADQELEACVEWLNYNYPAVNLRALRVDRRPKPLSLKLRIAEAIAKGNKHDALSLLDEAMPDD